MSDLPSLPAPFDSWCDCVLESVQELHYRVPDNAIEYALRELAELRAKRDHWKERYETTYKAAAGLMEDVDAVTAERDALRKRIADSQTRWLPPNWSDTPYAQWSPFHDSFVRVRIVLDPEDIVAECGDLPVGGSDATKTGAEGTP